MKQKPIYLVDSSIYIFRSWFAMPDSITNAEGQSINAVYGFLLFISKLLKHLESGYIAFAFDESLESCFRNRIYPDYKSSRGLPDENLAWQLSTCKKLTKALGVSCFSSKRYEADDLLGSLSAQLTSSQEQVFLISRDKDLAQLLKMKDKLWDFPDGECLDRAGFKRKSGVAVEQLVDFLALTGDKVDDIPGVAGLGPKTACFLLEHFGSLEKIYLNLDKVELLDIRGAKSIKRKLESGKDLAFISQQLARIFCDLKLVESREELLWQGFSRQRFNSALTRAGIEGRSRKAICNAFSDLPVK